MSPVVRTLAVLSLLVGAAAGCSSAGDPATASTTTGAGTAPAATLPFTAPTKAQLAEAAGLAFPAQTTEFRTVLIDPRQLDLSFGMSRSDLDAFVTGSALTLSKDQRVVTHVSPLWTLSPAGSISGGADDRGALRRAVEVVDDGGPSLTVRVVLTPTS